MDKHQGVNAEATRPAVGCAADSHHRRPAAQTPPSLRRAACVILSSLLLLAFCSPPTDPDPRPTLLHYTVTVEDNRPDTVHVRIDVGSWGATDRIRFALPPVYADNPVLPLSGPVVHNLRITDTTGREVGYASDSTQFGLYNSLAILAGAGKPLVIEYDAAFAYTPFAGMPMPSASTSSGYLQGTYLFALPYTGSTDLTALWRTPWDMRLTYELPSGAVLRGDPIDGALDNGYELLFSTSALGGQVLTTGTAHGQQFTIVNLQDTTYGDSMVNAMHGGFAASLGEIVDVFGDLGSQPMTVILGVNRGGGLEGMYGFSIINPGSDDVHGIWQMVAAHEAVHCWVGIRAGDYDDAWWKEGTTNYLGLYFARRTGWCSAWLVEQTYLADLADSAEVRDNALSSPRVRTHLFVPDSGLSTLTYVKGAQVNMLAERLIGEASGWSTSLAELVGEFCGLHDGGAFHRSEYLSFIQTRSGADLSSLFARYVDQPGAIPVDTLQHAYDILTQAGVLTPAGAVAKEATPPRQPVLLKHW